MAARLEKRAAQAKAAGTPVWIDEDDEAAVLAGAKALREVERMREAIRAREDQINHLFRHSGRQGSEDYDALEVSAAWDRLRAPVIATDPRETGPLPTPDPLAPHFGDVAGDLGKLTVRTETPSFIDAIRPGMPKADLDRIRQEIARVATLSATGAPWTPEDQADFERSVGEIPDMIDSPGPRDARIAELEAALRVANADGVSLYHTAWNAGESGSIAYRLAAQSARKKFESDIDAALKGAQ